MVSKQAGMLEQLGGTIEHFSGKDVRDKVMAGSGKVHNAFPVEMARWVKGAMERLDSLVDKATAARIMEECGHNCASVNKVINRAKARRSKHATVEEFLAAEVEKPMRGTRLVREGNVLYQYYTPQSFGKGMRCYCGLMRHLPAEEVVSPTYCQCSKGFVTKFWEAALGRPVKVEVLESALTGARECKFAISL